MSVLTPQQLLQYYQNLLIIQYNGLPKSSATISALANCNVCDTFYTTLANAFNLNPALGPVAVGNQLTIIGRVVGVPRQIYGLNLNSTFMNFSDWRTDAASVGFNTWANRSPDPDQWDSWFTTAIYTPSDFEMLALIQLKILFNNCYHSMGILIPKLWALFGNGIQLVDNLNSTITYNFSSPYHNVGSVAQFLNNICPRPAGIPATYNLV